VGSRRVLRSKGAFRGSPARNLRRSAAGRGNPAVAVGWLVRLRFRDSAWWERTAFQIVNHIIVVIVIDDRRTITLPRIIALWRISLRWRIGLKRVVLRQSLPS